jgi:dTDP-glucose 4,6-dehydratase
MRRILITGIGGFAGHHFYEHVLLNTPWEISGTDSFRHKGTTDRVDQVLNPEGRWLYPQDWRQRTQIITHDLCAPFSARQVRALQDRYIDYMVCFASESHVDRSITDPVSFCRNNFEVALNTLELARKLRPKALIWISTDEVYGPVAADDVTGHPEWAPILPSNPYASSKAAQEALAISYWRTYGVPVVLVNCMNMFGERQDTEKFIPMVIGKVLKGEEVTVHGTPADIGTRHYLHARNLADAILFLLNKPVHTFPAHAGATNNLTAGRPDRYNIVGPDRVDNLTLAKMIAEYAGESLRYRLEDFHATRPGHDPHYGLDPAKLTGLGWTPPVPFGESLRKTVEWTKLHPEWLTADEAR